MKLTRINSICLAFILAGMMSIDAAFAETKYSILDLGSLNPQYDTFGYNINNDGQAVGRSYINPTIYHGYLWDQASGMRNFLNTPDDSRASAKNINNLGQVVGSIDRDTAQNYYGAFFWDPTEGLTILGTLGGYSGTAEAINDLGQVGGRAARSDGLWHAFIWDETDGMREFLNMGETDSNVSGMNNAGQVVGRIDDQAYVWDVNNGIQVLGDGSAIEINQLGQIVGGGPADAFLWDNGQMIDLGQGLALGINDYRQIVGYEGSSLVGSQEPSPFYWEDGMRYNLNDLIPSDSGWMLYEADSINNKGQIIGSGNYNGARHAFLLDPVSSSIPEPATVLLIGAGLAGAFLRKRRT